MTESQLPCWSCAAETAGKQKCEHWCGQPGKCLSNMQPPRSAYIRFVREGGGSINHFTDSNTLRLVLKELGVQCIREPDGTMIVSRSDLDRLTHWLERLLRALAPEITFGVALPGPVVTDIPNEAWGAPYSTSATNDARAIGVIPSSREKSK